MAFFSKFPEAALFSMVFFLNQPLLDNGSNDFLLSLKTSSYWHLLTSVKMARIVESSLNWSCSSAVHKLCTDVFTQ